MRTVDERGMVLLLQTVMDSAAGYSCVVDRYPHCSLHEHCDRQAAERRALASRLMGQMAPQSIADPPPDFLGGSMHRLFVDLDASLNRDDQAMLKALQRGDALLAHRIEKAIVEGVLEEPIEQILRELCRVVNESQSRLSAELSSRRCFTNPTDT